MQSALGSMYIHTQSFVRLCEVFRKNVFFENCLTFIITCATNLFSGEKRETIVKRAQKSALVKGDRRAESMLGA